MSRYSPYSNYAADSGSVVNSQAINEYFAYKARKLRRKEEEQEKSEKQKLEHELSEAKRMIAELQKRNEEIERVNQARHDTAHESSVIKGPVDIRMESDRNSTKELFGYAKTLVTKTDG